MVVTPPLSASLNVALPIFAVQRWRHDQQREAQEQTVYAGQKQGQVQDQAPQIHGESEQQGLPPPKRTNSRGAHNTLPAFLFRRPNKANCRTTSRDSRSRRTPARAKTLSGSEERRRLCKTSCPARCRAAIECDECSQNNHQRDQLKTLRHKKKKSNMRERMAEVKSGHAPPARASERERNKRVAKFIHNYQTPDGTQGRWLRLLASNELSPHILSAGKKSREGPANIQLSPILRATVVHEENRG